MRRLLLPVFVLCTYVSFAQMGDENEVRYGNEWIDYSLPHFAIPIGSDGLYRVEFLKLKEAGFPVNTLEGGDIRLFNLGDELPLTVSTSGIMTTGDYIEFYAEKNKGQVDRWLYKDPGVEVTNPHYSMFTDTAIYYLTYRTNGDARIRYQEVENTPEGNEVPVEKLRDIAMVEYHERPWDKRYGSDFLLSLSSVDEGEGFVNTINGTHDIVLPVEAADPLGGDANLELRVASNSGGGKLKVTYGNHVLSDSASFGIFDFQVLYYTIPASVIAAEEPIIHLEGLTGPTDRYVVGMATLTYDRDLTYEQTAQIDIPISAFNGKRSITLNGNMSPVPSPILLDRVNQIRMDGISNGNQLSYHIPTLETRTTLQLMDEGDWIAVEDNAPARLYFKQPAPSIQTAADITENLEAVPGNADLDTPIIENPQFVESPVDLIQPPSSIETAQIIEIAPSTGTPSDSPQLLHSTETARHFEGVLKRKNPFSLKPILHKEKTLVYFLENSEGKKIGYIDTDTLIHSTPLEKYLTQTIIVTGTAEQLETSPMLVIKAQHVQSQ